MHRVVAPLPILACAIAFSPRDRAAAEAPPAQAFDDGVAAPVAGRPPDSDAPAGAPPHWLPHDMWVHVHWVPFDEARLQSLLKADRGELWRWLRHDLQTLAQPGAQRGYPSAGKLADALVAPRARDVSAARLRTLRARTLRVLVRGHLSQYLIFHSQAGPEATRELFGVRDTATFQRLRQLDLSPLRIGRTHGRTREQMQGGLERELRAAAQEGVQNNRTYAKRYGNVVVALGDLAGTLRVGGGSAAGRRVETAYDPAPSADGNVVAWQSVRADPMSPSTRWATRARVLDARSHPAVDIPRDGAYDAALSGDGRHVAVSAFSGAGSRGVGRRLQVFVYDRETRRTALVSVLGRSAKVAAEAWEPSLSDDGRFVALAATTKAGGRARVYVRDMRVRVARPVSDAGDGFACEPAISGNGTRVVYSELERGTRLSRAGRPLQRVLARTLATGRASVVSVGAGGRPLTGWSGQPKTSADGTKVAFTSDAGTPAGLGPGGRRVFVRDLAARTTTFVSATTPLGAFSATALRPGDTRLCSLAPPAW